MRKAKRFLYTITVLDKQFRRWTNRDYTHVCIYYLESSPKTNFSSWHESLKNAQKAKRTVELHSAIKWVIIIVEVAK